MAEEWRLRAEETLTPTLSHPMGEGRGEGCFCPSLLCQFFGA